MNMTATQIKYLMALAAGEGEKKSLSDVARSFHVNRSTVSRVLAVCVKENLLDSGFSITDYGSSFIERMNYNYEKIQEWMRNNGVPEAEAAEDAIQILANCSEQTRKLLVQGGDLCKACNYFREKGHKLVLWGNQLDSYISRGDYKVAFSIHKGRKRGPLQHSMANEAFEHPAILSVYKGKTELRLKLRKVQQKSLETLAIMEGKMNSMKYEYENQIRSAKISADYASLSLEAMQFVYLQEDDILQGELKLFFTCTVGQEHMPESTALLKLYL